MTVTELERLEQAFSVSPQGALYVQGLKKFREETPKLTLEVCRAWHGSRFGWPGRRSYLWVAREIERARTAVVTILSAQLRDALTKPAVEEEEKSPISGIKKLEVQHDQ